MELFALLKESGLNTKEISKRLHLGIRTVQNYANGSQEIPEYIKKLIRYEFADYLPKGEGLTSKKIENSKVENGETENFKDENEILKKRVKELEQDKVDLKRDKEMLQLYIESLTGKSTDNQQTA
jgi:transcriptional regulator with XRE-family HTH domain